MNDRWLDRVSEYLDGDLDAAERRAFETHLAGCAGCRGLLEELRSVVAQARSAADVPPAPDLWPAIAARIRVTPQLEEETLAQVPTARPGHWQPFVEWLGRRWTFTVPQAAMAAAALMAVAGLSVWMALGRGPIPATTRGPAIAVQTNEPAADSTALTGFAAAAAVRSMDPRYDATIAELQRVLDQERNRLDPSTVQVLEKNLRIIDAALAEAVRAVESDPANLYLRQHLLSVMKRKVSLMRTATLLAEPPQG